MNDTSSNVTNQVRTAFRETVHEHWGWFLAEGIVLLILGTIAIFASSLASLAITVVIGWVLLVSGVAGAIFTFRARHVAGFGWSLVSALIGIVAGVLLLGWPMGGMFSLTVVLIAFLLAEGVSSIFYALEHRRGATTRWGWMLTSGIIDIALGLVLWAGMPGTALWAIGLLVGVNMIFGGWSLVFMALSARTSTLNPASGQSPRVAAPGG